MDNELQEIVEKLCRRLDEVKPSESPREPYEMLGRIVGDPPLAVKFFSKDSLFWVRVRISKNAGTDVIVRPVREMDKESYPAEWNVFVLRQQQKQREEQIRKVKEMLDLLPDEN